MIKLPNPTYSQPNNSDKFGSLNYVKNINLDEEGYIKLSPRSLVLWAENSGGGDFGTPLAIGKFNTGDFLVATDSDANYNVSIGDAQLDVEKSTLSPTLTINSHALFWQGLWFVSDNDDVFSRPVSTSVGETWTERISNTTSGVRKFMTVFANRLTLLLTSGNVVKQYSTAYANTTDLTVPSDYETVAMAYNNHQVGIITRLAAGSEGQNTSAYFFIWDGATTEANGGASLNSPAGVGICAYKSTFVVLTQTGKLLIWNGGALDELASFPFYFTDNVWGDLTSQIGRGDIMTSDGDVIYLNLGFVLESFGRKEEKTMPNLPSGVWCYDPKIGLYHRASGSISKARLLPITNVNTGTDTLTTTGTIPDTGNPTRYTDAATAIGGLTLNQDYYIIKLTSTTFRLAETKEGALQGAYIDLTSSGTGSDFWAYDLVDYGNSYNDDAGAVAVVGENNFVYGGLIFGGDYATTALASNDTMVIQVPFLENRGYLVTPKVYSSKVKDMTQSLLVRYRPLNTGDAIVLKVKTKDVIGLPVTSTGTSGATWGSSNELTTTADISEAKTFFDAGGSLEMEIISGAGGGTMVQVEDIIESSGTYTVTLAEDVIGASNGLKCHFILDNWEVVQTITSSSSSALEGQTEVPITKTSKWIMFKIELRGYQTTIEELLIVNGVQANTK